MGVILIVIIRNGIFKCHCCGFYGKIMKLKGRTEGSALCTACGIIADSHSVNRVLWRLRNNRDMAIALKDGVLNIVKFINALIITCRDHDVIIGDISLFHFAA